MTTNEVLYAVAGLAIGFFLFRRPPTPCSCPGEPPKSVGEMVAAGTACKGC
jgi:hypothetical protein